MCATVSIGVLASHRWCIIYLLWRGAQHPLLFITILWLPRAPKRPQVPASVMLRPSPHRPCALVIGCCSRIQHLRLPNMLLLLLPPAAHSKSGVNVSGVAGHCHSWPYCQCFSSLVTLHTPHNLTARCIIAFWTTTVTVLLSIGHTVTTSPRHVLTTLSLSVCCASTTLAMCPKGSSRLCWNWDQDRRRRRRRSRGFHSA